MYEQFESDDSAVTAPQLVEQFSVQVVLSDTCFERNGPGAEDCASERQRVDEIHFDGNFTCDCTIPDVTARSPDQAAAAATLLGGPNCLTPVLLDNQTLAAAAA